jgi:hypothetical protein
MRNLNPHNHLRATEGPRLHDDEASTERGPAYASR